MMQDLIFLQHQLEKNQEAKSLQCVVAVKIQVIIPAFNEEKTIEDVITRVQKILRKIGYPYEILVIDDGSNDQTAQFASASGAICYRNPQNRGKGFSLIRGFKLANKSDYIITIDSDGEHFPEDIPQLLAPILNNEAEMVIGSRFLPVDRKLKQGSYLNNCKKHTQFRKLGTLFFLK